MSLPDGSAGNHHGLMHIGVVSPDQHDSLSSLLVEAHAHHSEVAAADDAMRAHLTDQLLAPHSPVRLVVAVEPNSSCDVVGVAALVLLPSVIEPTGDARWQCQLKELYVRGSHRGQGVGEALVAWSAGYALEHGCGRMDWNVQAGNAGGIRFYTGLGATPVMDRLSYRVDRVAMERLVGETRSLTRN